MENIVTSRRIGSFTMPITLIQQHPSEVLAIMKYVLVVDTVHDTVNDVIVYVGYSQFFEPVPSHTTPPEYVWIIERDSNNNIDHIRVDVKG